jgi:hypothetical protein
MMSPHVNRDDDDNGRPWPVWLKTLCAVVLVASGFGTGWCTWVTSNIYASQRTTGTVEQLVSDVRAHDVQFTNLPPEEWKERVRNIETELRLNQVDHTSIKVSLEQIKAKLGVADGP